MSAFCMIWIISGWACQAYRLGFRDVKGQVGNAIASVIAGGLLGPTRLLWK